MQNLDNSPNLIDLVFGNNITKADDRFIVKKVFCSGKASSQKC